MSDFTVVDKLLFAGAKWRGNTAKNKDAYDALMSGKDILLPKKTGIAAFRTQARVAGYRHSQRTVENGIVIRWTKKP